MSFSYHALYRTAAEQPSGLIAMRVWTGPLEAVVWSVPKRIWMFAPELAAPRIFDDRYEDRTRPVDRPEAERIARDLLETTLPDETELLRMCEERRTGGTGPLGADERANLQPDLHRLATVRSIAELAPDYRPGRRDAGISDVS